MCGMSSRFTTIQVKNPSGSLCSAQNNPAIVFTFDEGGENNLINLRTITIHRFQYILVTMVPYEV